MVQGKIVSKQEFMKNSPFTKEQYEGILTSVDAQAGCYNIGIQLSENEILVVEQASDQNIRDRLLAWSNQVDAVQQQYGVKRNPGYGSLQ